MKTRGRVWTEEERQKQREVALNSQFWQKSTGATSEWGRFCSSLNGYKSMPDTPVAQDERGVLTTAAMGLVQIMEFIVEQRIKPSEQNIKDFRLALVTLYKLGAFQDMPPKYGELFQNLIRLFEKDELPHGVLSSESDESLSIAAASLREVIERSSLGQKRFQQAKTQP